MCLFTNLSDIKIAEKSKRYIKKIKITTSKTTWTPYYQSTCKTTDGETIVRKYPFNKILDAEDDNSNKIIHLTLIKSPTKINTVREGFHAYVIFPDYDIFYKKLYKIVVIPRGAEYVISDTGREIVANKIIVFSSKFRYILYKMFGNLSLHTNE
jgi:3D (Asp-Asp-Asp) domain-containing protein